MAERVVVTRDLMDGGRFRAAVPDVVIVRSPDAPELADATFVLLDLGAGIDPSSLVEPGRTVVAYGAHVDEAALAAAIEAGCAEALPRSRVFRRAAELLAE
ncbi:MAG: hypothetical protein AAGA90_13035 [Actinomycetota bacterium]